MPRTPRPTGGTTASQKARMEQEHRKPAEPRPAKPKKKNNQKRTLLVVLAAVLLVAIVSTAAVLLIYSKDDGLIFNNVYAMGMNLSGMTQQQVEDAVNRLAEDVYNQTLTIELQDRTLVLTPDAVGIHVDAAAIAQAAFDYGREGNMFQRAKARAAADLTTHNLDVTDYLSLDRDYIETTIRDLGDSIYTELKQPSVTVAGKKPDLSQYAVDPYLENEEDEVPSDLTIVSTDEVFYIEDGQTMTIQMGTAGRELDTEALVQRVIDAYTNADFTTISTTYDVVQPQALDAQEIYEEYCILPVEPVLDEETYKASKEVLGYGFLLEDLQKILAQGKEGETAQLRFRILLPKTTKKEIDATYFQDVLVSLKTPHTWNNNRTTNLRLAAQMIDGAILAPGETFSFNDTVGERTAEKGYKEATVYSGGNSVQEVGGGICQVASTLYYGALLTDFTIVERAVHSFAVDYVPMGMDATIYWGHLDFKFANNTEYPVRIDISVHDGYVWLEYVGTETKDYYVVMRWDGKEKTDWETEYVLLTEDNKEKYKDYELGDTLVSPYTGYKGWTYKYKYDRETDELISKEKEAYSDYSVRNKKVLVDKIPEETEPTEPTDPPTEPTDPPTEPTDPPTDPTDPPTDPTDPPGGDGGDGGDGGGG